MQVTHPLIVFVNVQTQFTVTVKTATLPPIPLQYAKVCLNKSGDIYLVGSTNASGQVTFTIQPHHTGTIKVTVTRLHNADNNYNQYRPSQTTCSVIDPGGGGQSAGSGKVIPQLLSITGMPTIVQDNVCIDYGIPNESDVTFLIYDINGSLIDKFHEAKRPPGYYQKTIILNNLPTGIYFLILKQNQCAVTRKLLIVK